MNADGSQTYWRNSPDANLDGQPDQAVPLLLSRGLYSLALGDTNLANMAPLPADVFTNSALYLRLWLNDGTHDFEALVPDQRVTPAGYAMISATVTDGAITVAKLAPGVLDAANLTGVLDPARLPASVAHKDTDLLSTSNTLSGRLVATNAALLATIDALAATVQALSNQLAALQSGSPASLPPAGLTAVSVSNSDASLAGYGFVPFMSVAAPAWVDGTATDAPLARNGRSAVWTGEEMVVWGGILAPGLYSAAGGSYDPDANQWGFISPINAPGARAGHTAIWTGTEMIIWGGLGGASYLNTGARWERGSQIWSALPALNAPAGRDGHVVLWTGARMLVWGGRNSGGLLADGALYDPVSNLWSALTLPGAPSARFGAIAAWTGSRAIIWGGEGEIGALNHGAQLLFDAGGEPTEWRTLSGTGAPSARSGHTAVWTGQRLVVWGGQNAGAPLGDGAIYDPVGDAWSDLPSADAPSARSGHQALWTGQEMLVFGGQDASGPLATGAAHDPARGLWRALSSAGNPRTRSGGTAVWSGSELLVFGGSSAPGALLAELERLNPQPTWYFYRKP